MVCGELRLDHALADFAEDGFFGFGRECGQSFGDARDREDGEGGAELGRGRYVFPVEEAIDDFEGGDAQLAEPIADAFGMDLARAGKRVAERGLGPAPIMDGGAVHASDASGFGDGSPADEGCDDPLLNRRGDINRK